MVNINYFLAIFFSSPELLDFLKTKKQESVAILKANRSRGCPIRTEEDRKRCHDPVF